MSVQSELDRIIGLVNESHEKVKAKGGTNNEPYLLANLPGAIESIPNGVELPPIAEDVLGKASDLAKDKQLIGPNGEVVTGTLEENNLGGTFKCEFIDGNIKNTYTPEADRIIRAGTELDVGYVWGDELGYASPADVRAGVYFTSAFGLKIPGEMEETPGIELPDIAEDVLGKSSDLAKDKQLIDPDGNIVTGTLSEVPVGTSLFGTHGYKTSGTKGNTTFNVVATWSVDDLDGVIVRNGASLGAQNVPTSLLGDAECSDVAKGKIFTSIAGYLAEGTREESGITLPEGAIVVQKVIGEQASTQIGTGYSLSVTYGDSVEINDSVTLAFIGTTKNLSNISANTDFSVLSDKYVRTGSTYGSTTGTSFYYIPADATFTVSGQSMSKTLTCDKAQKVTMEKVSL